MHRFLGLCLFAIVACAFSVSLPAQTIKMDPKPDPKAETKFTWPKEIMGKNLDAWVREMKSSRDASTRDQAIRTVPLFGPDSMKAASANLLFALTKDPDINVKLTAIATIPVLGFDLPEREAGLNALVNIVKPNSGAASHTRYETVMCLANCGPIARRAIPTLAEYTIFDQNSWQNRKAAVYALGRLGVPVGPETGPDLQAVKALVKCLRTETSHQIRREAINSLLLLGPPRIEAAWRDLRDALIHTMRDPDHSIEIWARVAYIRTELELIKPNDPNLAALAKYLTSSDLARKAEALQAFGLLGDEAKSRLADIIAVATNEKEELVMVGTAIWVLAQIPAETAKILPVLDQLKKHKEEGIRKAADAAYMSLTAPPTGPKIELKFDPKLDPKKKK